MWRLSAYVSGDLQSERDLSIAGMYIQYRREVYQSPACIYKADSIEHVLCDGWRVWCPAVGIDKLHARDPALRLTAERCFPLKREPISVTSPHDSALETISLAHSPRRREASAAEFIIV